MQLKLFMPKTNFKSCSDEDDTCAHLPGYLLPFFFPFHTIKQNKYPNQHPHAYNILNCTINATLTYFLPYLTHKMI